MAAHFIGVDVGTGSARAGVFDENGTLLAVAKRPINIWQEAGDVVEQSSEDIWSAVSTSVREAVAASGVDTADIRGLGFDATCSLVAVTADGSPVAVGSSGDPKRNIIVWMDHRAAGEAEEINAGGHEVLRYVGGRISPEMETPKLLWLKRNLPDSFAAAEHFFDLADYLTWRATGCLTRSTCTVTCKWTYLAHENRWDSDYFNKIGLEELVAERFARIGTEIAQPGTRLASGLTETAAAELGLQPGTAVAASLIDAHAGGLGTLGAAGEGVTSDIGRRLAYIFGTSACSMASSQEPVFVNGVWGPYFSAMIPDLWLNEGGQSAAGAAIDHLVAMHPASASATGLAEAAGTSLVGWLDAEASKMCSKQEDVMALARRIHVVPEFLGNRSPNADPDARAVVAGLSLDAGIPDLVALYIAGLCGIGYGLRQLLIKLGDDGIPIDLIIASGGAAQSDLVRQLLADATGVRVAVIDNPEPVLLGSAMLAAVASGHRANLADAMTAMSRISRVFEPAQGTLKRVHEIRYSIFKRLQSVDREIRTELRMGLQP
ncbi:FGGY-family carbohydrate kinase [Phyllobacterium chamaecytisi]|uniref:FGGY-family carbohydrate kinase n=1 Tax=Phyllobacterium chamaecytisi TaxID=2876082 RepID=UPI001CCE0D97|nr:FGGY-family carbohydrate kinase [Phyllobacterium sp. KW56]MBZ9602619.1 FGGY-family carbohydrate kinase [Phyllobacterium sp. KW56]